VAHHSVSAGTRTLELAQIEEINDHLEGCTDPALLRAQDLGLAGARLHPGSVDAVAAHRAHLSPHLVARPLTDDPLRSDAQLLHLVAAGSPSFPYIWGLFGRAVRDDGNAPLTPVELHTEQLARVSRQLHLHHRWGL
jgi:hypothetical protein